MIKTLRKARVKGKKVLTRVDLNLKIGPEGEIVDSFRFKAILPTLSFLTKNGAKVILISHLGDPRGKADKRFSLKRIAHYLSREIKKQILFVPKVTGSQVKKAVLSLKPGDILMLENLRFHQGEEEDSLKFAKELADLGEIYVNDAFSVSHRRHASIVSLPQLLPSFMGFLFEKEIKNLDLARKVTRHPFVLIVGGAKISDKIRLLQYFKNRADKILLGGALANNVLKAKGVNIGKSLFEPGAKKISQEVARWKNVLLPYDAVISSKSGFKVKYIDSVASGDKILDIGPRSIEAFCDFIKSARKIVWNGPLGLVEEPKFALGSKKVAQAIAASQALAVIGGGDTAVLIRKLGFLNRFDWVSTGGGAMLDYLARGTLVGIKALEE